MTQNPLPTIAFLTHSLSDAYGAQLWEGALDAAREGRANLLCFPGWAPGSPRGFEAQANIIYDFVTAESVDGVIISSGVFSEFIGRRKLNDFCKRFGGLPLVSIAVQMNGIPSVLVADYQGVHRGVSHLIEVHNKKKIAFLTEPLKNPQAMLRYKGYKAALASHHLDFDPGLVAPAAEWREDCGVQAVGWLLDEKKLRPGVDFDAIMAGNDNLAHGALRELQSRQVPVPASIALVGFDSLEGSKYLTPSLTSVYQPIYGQGQKAVETLLARIKGEPVEERLQLPTRLVIRQSCGCPNPMLMLNEASWDTEAGKREPGVAPARGQAPRPLRLLKRAMDSAIAVPASIVEGVFDSLSADIQSDDSAAFLPALEKALRETAEARGDLSIWQDAILVMRQQMGSELRDEPMFRRLSRRFQQARMMIAEHIQKEQGYSTIQKELRTTTLNEINQELISTSNEKELMRILSVGLPELKIPSAFVSLYRNPSSPTDGLLPILVHQESPAWVPAGQILRGAQWIPSGWRLKERPCNLVIEPLYYRQNQIGIAAFEMGPRDGAVYETLRGQLSSALWGSHLVQYLGSLYAASSTLISVQQPNSILHDIVNQACQAVDAQWADVVLVDRDGRPQRLAVGGKQSHFLKTVPPITRQAVTMENITRQTKPVYKNMAREGVGAAASFPLRMRGRQVGSLWIFYDKPHRFLETEKGALRLYANHAAVAYDNARRTTELVHLRQAAEQLAKVAEVKQVLRQIVKSARAIFEADSAVLWSYDAARHIFLPDELVADGVKVKILNKFKKNTPRENGTAHTVMEKGYIEVNNLDDARYDPLKSPRPRLRHSIGVKSFQGIALKVEGEPLGVLYVNHNKPRGFNDDDQTTLTTLAYDAALALKKARLLERLRKGHEATRIVAEASVLDNIRATLQTIARGTQSALSCDAVTLYMYDEGKKEIGFPPAMVGVLHKHGVLKDQTVQRDSILYQVIARNDMLVADDVFQHPWVQDRPFVQREGVKSLVALPLKVGAHKVGVMFVNYRHAHHFTEEECADIALFADQAAVAIRNAQLYDAATRRTTYVDAFLQAGKAISGTLALDEILKRITTEACSITHRTAGPQALFSFLALVEDHKLRMKSAFPAKYLPEMQKVADNLDFRKEKGRIGISGRAVQSGKTQLVKDTSQHPDYIEGTVSIKSELSVPILSGDRVIGVIDVEHPRLGAFDEEDQQALEALAAQAAIAIQYAHLHEVTRRQATQLTTASKMAQDITAILDTKELLDRIVKLISERFGFYHAGIFLLDHDGKYVELKAASSKGGRKMLRNEHKLEVGKEGIVGFVAESRQAIRAMNVGEDVHFFNNPYLPDTHSEIALPIQVQGRLLGVLDVQSTEQKAFSDGDELVLQTMADHLAVAIENARNYENLKQMGGFVGNHTAIEWMKMVSHVWGHSINREVGKGLLKTDTIRQACEKGEFDKILPVLDPLEEVLTQIGKIPITAPLKAEDSVSAVSINRILRGYLTAQWDHADYKPVELIEHLQGDLDEVATIQASEGWLRRGLEILVENAVQAMTENDCPKKELTVITFLEGKKIHIQICDTGPGMPDSVYRKIFEKGEPLDKQKGSRGVGVGLFIARTIFDAYRGQLTVPRRGSDGTTMEVTLEI